MSLYLEELMEHYSLPRNWGRLESPTHTARVANPLCGDIIELDLKIDDRGWKIEEIGYVTEGCAICRAAMSRLSEEIKGKPIDQLPYMDSPESTLSDQSKGRRNTILDLLKIQLSPTRLKCALLARDAVLAAISPLKF